MTNLSSWYILDKYCDNKNILILKVLKVDGSIDIGAQMRSKLLFDLLKELDMLECKHKSLFFPKDLFFFMLALLPYSMYSFVQQNTVTLFLTFMFFF